MTVGPMSQDGPVLQVGGETKFPQEPIRAEHSGRIGAHDLEGNGPVELEVVSEIDRRHPAAAEFSLEEKAVVKGFRLWRCQGHRRYLDRSAQMSHPSQGWQRSPHSLPQDIRFCPEKL